MQAISLKSRALRYLSSREHSRLELAKKLARHATEGDDINALLDWLTASQFLSEKRFSESLLNRRAARFGNSRILHELRNHGIEGDVLEEIKTKLERDEVARTVAVWSKKFGQIPGSANEREKQMRFLLQRGFSHRAIQVALQGKWDIED